MGGRRSCKVYTERFVFFFFSTRYTVDAVTNIFGSGSRRNAKYAYYARTKSFLGENTNFGPEQISRRNPARRFRANARRSSGSSRHTKSDRRRRLWFFSSFFFFPWPRRRTTALTETTTRYGRAATRVYKYRVYRAG